MKFPALLLSLSVLATGVSAKGKSPVPLDNLGNLAVLDGGRIKPLDSYARHSLLQLSARGTYRGEPAIQWLARVLFAPKTATEDDVFRIHNEEVAYALGIEPEKDHRYSFAQLSPNINKLSELAEAAMKVEEKKRSPMEAECIRVANNLSLYLGVMNGFLFGLPHPDFRISDTALAALLGMQPREEPYRYLDIRQGLSKAGDTLAKLGGDHADHQGHDHEHEHDVKMENRTDAERKLLSLSRRFENWSRHYGNFPVNIIPPATGGKDWKSAWGLAATAKADPSTGSASSPRAGSGSGTGAEVAIAAMGDMVEAYGAGDEPKFSGALEKLHAFVDEKSGKAISRRKVGLEIAYNRIGPFFWAKIFYGFSALAALLGLVFFGKWLRPIATALLSLGILSQAVGLGLRLAVTGRAPVTNMFETFVFVAWVGALLGLILEFYNRKGFGTLVGALTGFAILLISIKYSADGDTIGVLVAVLNSNFWLTTHVITISLGYAGCCLAGVVGHLYLIQAAFRKPDREKLEALSHMTYAVLAFGLIFSFIGTVLGGIWADQSWGRFWGWDPKENGALMIVLWGAILFHAKLGKMIGPFGMAAGCVIGIIVVMMAWFGINLLGVGLHSYGFTSGVANALGIYVAAEIAFLAGAGILIWKQGRLPAV